MFSFESFVDLPLIWFGIIATAIFLYILLDGFDLGVGIFSCIFCWTALTSGWVFFFRSHRPTAAATV
jgi:cytochrome bd-type quinol oxidase subunit 2